MEQRPTRRPITKDDLPLIAVGSGSRPCPVCGAAMDVREGVAGRPRLTCSPACRDVAKVEAILDALREDAHPRAILALRARVWRVLNGRAWNRGVKRRGNV